MSSKGAPLYVKVIVVIIIIVVSFFSIKKQKKNKLELENQHRFTIGITEGASSNHRGSTDALHYSFRVNGLKYRGLMNLKSLSGIKTRGAEYIVKYDPKNPKNSELLIDKPVIFHPAVLEDTGWLIVPDYILYYRNDSIKK